MNAAVVLLVDAVVIVVVVTLCSSMLNTGSLGLKGIFLMPGTFSTGSGSNE